MIKSSELLLLATADCRTWRGVARMRLLQLLTWQWWWWWWWQRWIGLVR